MQSSVHGRLGPRVSEQDAQLSHWRGGGDFCGAIFMCNRRTWKECLVQSLFGLPIGKKDLVQQVVPGMRLFLFEYERRQLWGVFEAASYGEMNIIPNAYSGGSFPCQVRVKVPAECVALYEQEFREAVKENYFSDGKFHFDLSEKQVCHLTSLFERKYLSAGNMHSNYLEYDDKQYHAVGCEPSRGLPSLLDKDVTALYRKEFLQHGWFSSSCQVASGTFLLSAEEGMDPCLTKTGNRISHEKGFSVPFSDRALEIVQNTIYNLTEDTAAGDLVISPNEVSSLHSDRPSAKSVWTRLSGRSKASVDLESAQTKKIPSVNSVPVSLPLCTISELDVLDDRSTEDLVRAEVSDEALEEFLVGFKRRRAGSNIASTSAHETATTRRRKITRPSFDEVTDEDLVEQGEDNCFIPSADGSFANSVGGAMVDSRDICMPSKFPLGIESKVSLFHDRSCSTALDLGKGIARMEALGSNQGNGFLQAGQDFCKANALDLNLPVEVSNEDEQAMAYEGIAAVTDLLDTKKQGSDLQQAHVSSECTSVDLSSSRASTFSLASCSPAKDFLQRLHTCSKHCDDGKGSSDLEHDMPFRLELGNGVQLLDPKLHVGEPVAETSCKKESAMLDESANGNQGNDSNTVSLHCTPESNLLNQVDLKPFQNGIQVLGIKLQIGESGESSSILQRGDATGSTSNVDSQEQRGASPPP